MKTRGSWSSTPDALPGTEFVEGVWPEADSGEFSDDLWSNRSHGRLRENHVSTPDQSESLVVIWTRSEIHHNGPRPRCVASRGLTHVRTIRRLDEYRRTTRKPGSNHTCNLNRAAGAASAAIAGRPRGADRPVRTAPEGRTYSTTWWGTINSLAVSTWIEWPCQLRSQLDSTKPQSCKQRRGTMF